MPHKVSDRHRYGHVFILSLHSLSSFLSHSCLIQMWYFAIHLQLLQCFTNNVTVIEYSMPCSHFHMHLAVDRGTRHMMIWGACFTHLSYLLWRVLYVIQQFPRPVKSMRSDHLAIYLAALSWLKHIQVCIMGKVLTEPDTSITKNGISWFSKWDIGFCIWHKVIEIVFNVLTKPGAKLRLSNKSIWIQFELIE